jgi:hypothetical protein
VVVHYHAVLISRRLGASRPAALALATWEVSHLATRESGTTSGGYPLPLTGKVLATSPVIVKQEGVNLNEYPEYYIPGREDLAADEMRISACGSGNPPVRRGQGATCWLVELGNGDNFIFDIGVGTHYFQDDDLIDPFFDGIASTYDGARGAGPGAHGVQRHPRADRAAHGENGPVVVGCGGPGSERGRDIGARVHESSQDAGVGHGHQD